MYRTVARPLIFRMDAQTAHEHALHVLRYFDDHPALLSHLNRLLFRSCPVEIGGVQLSSPLILAAGLVKGDGFASEADALSAVRNGCNIMPGWRSMPALVGAVEFGSFTRYPRLGNSGVVLWRDAATRSTQNRIGLKNPGAHAAAEFLAARPLPLTSGINIAVSPGVTDAAQEQQEVIEAVEAFLSRHVRPAWFTLNISCPNTEDDPDDHQTETRTRDLCSAVINHLDDIPLWVKISPYLATSQYDTLLRVFAETGVRGVVATNTQPEPAPTDRGVTAGVGGGRLHHRAVEVAGRLMEQKQRCGYELEVIGCGGVQNPSSYQAFALRGIRVVQYWSALIYQGPLAAALIVDEV